jgi:hypothetical protein
MEAVCLRSFPTLGILVLLAPCGDMPEVLVPWRVTVGSFTVRFLSAGDTCP